MLKVYDECCANCLLSPDAIVSPARRREILDDCATEQRDFICHKASMRGDEVVCHTFFEKLGHVSQRVRIMGRLGAIEMVPQPAAERLPSYRENEAQHG